jgi:putative aldouronate transport system substrate-binding protein
VKNEFANATNIFNANYKALIMGFTEDPEGDIQKLIEKYKAAGLDKIMSEAQSQVDTFLSTFGK